MSAIYTMFRLIAGLMLMAVSVSLSAQQATISGRIATRNNESVSGVTIFVTGQVNAQTLTDENGNYAVQVPVGGSYVVRPEYDLDPLNGVSTLDAVLIVRHIEGTEPFTSPYQFIAADVDRNSIINALDTFDLRNLILGVTEEFPNNSSWRFVDAAYQFPNPANPLSLAYPGSVVVSNFSADVTGVNFVAVKTGDVNSTSLTSLRIQEVHFSSIRGRVFHDANDNCQGDTGEYGPVGWVVRADGALGSSFFGATLPNGEYRINVPPGSYTVSVVLPSSNVWNIQCNNAQPVVFAESMEQALGVNFGVRSDIDCPQPEVNIGIPFLRRCVENTYTVRYTNQGSELIEDAYVNVTLDPFFTFVGSSLPVASVNGSTYRFDVGDLDVFETRTFTVTISVSCEAELGQTHCISAEMFPVAPCMIDPNWSGASLRVEGECQGDRVVFTITNEGEDMNDPVEYIVIEDIMIQIMEDDLLLGSGQMRQVELPANGSTWRLELRQVAFHPDNNYQAAFVEGCGTGESSFGFINQFALGDEKPNYDLDCRDNIGAYDPNDKQGFPLGVGEQGFIRPGQPLDYLIRFQNTGTDTAFTVIIRDTLSEWLDPASIRPGTSSHPYAFNFSDENAIQFVFSNIMLPDSNVNEPASHGFVRFSIRQRPDVPLGTAIRNSAGIYFDFNEPVITNTTLHTVQENFLITVDVKDVALRPGLELTVFPNPAAHSAQFRLSSGGIERGLLQVWNAQGQLVGTQPFSGDQTTWNASGMRQGLYFFQIVSGGQTVASGKLLVRR
ncbi:MAG TPA: T9SS type A sorting domain-containing protein [Saprospiraceae bacterium]|nr:T9SS type A sorting domain-containing protein [Saprospiraceae bacterium]